MPKIYKVNTGINSFSSTQNETIRDAIYSILNKYFPNELIKTQFGSYDHGITGPGLTESNCLVVGMGNSFYNLFSNDWGNRNGRSIIYSQNSDYGINSGPLCIYYTSVKNGVLMATCGENDNYKLYFTKLWYKGSNGHIYFHDFNDVYSSSYPQIYTRDLMTANYPYANNPLPKAAPYISTPKISMTKMLLGSTIQDDFYVATVMPNVSTSAQSFIINDKEYISIAQKDGYCPAVLECLNEN